MRLPADIFEQVCGMLDTRDLARLDTVVRVTERAWTHAIHRRCGDKWCSGKAGAMRLYVAVRAQGTRILAGLPPLWAEQTCVCIGGDGYLATGNEYGLALGRLGGQPSQVWFGGHVVSVACLHDGTVWFCTSLQRGYTYCDGMIKPLYAHEQVLSVSGPVGMVGTLRGTLPVVTIPMPCKRIAQSAVLIATWHTNGHVCTLDASTLQPLYMFDTGAKIGQFSAFSVIGDIVCVSGTSWRNGKCDGTCPCDTRTCTADGLTVIVHRANVGIRVIT